MRLTTDTLGSDNVLFAAYHPFENVRESVAAIDAASVAESNKCKLYSENAKRVFRL